MKQLFFVSIFFFGVFFFVRPPMVSAAAGDSCTGDNKVGFSGTCQTYETCGGNPNNFDSSEATCSPDLLCCRGVTAGGPTTGSGGDSTGRTCVSSIDGSTGTCQTRANCVGGALGNANICTDGLGCCVGGTAGTGAGTGSGGSFGTGTGSGSGSSAGGSAGTVLCDGVMRSGICFPTGTGLSSAPVGFLLMRLMSWLLALFGMIAIIAFVISGMQYLISAGNEEMIETAKRNMQYSMIGVLVGLSGWVIIRAIDQALGGTSLLSTILCLFGVC